MYTEQIKNREELLGYYNKQVRIAEIQKQILRLQLEDLRKLSKGFNNKGIEKSKAESRVNSLFKDLIQDIGIVPIDSSPNNNIQKALEDELKDFFTADIKNLPEKYSNSTSEGVKVNYTTAEGIKQMNQSSPQKENRILVVDVKYLPSEYKGMTPDKVVELLEESYGHSVFLIDSSAQNLQGSASAYNNPPIYFA
jgi:uncharacterized protein YdaT